MRRVRSLLFVLLAAALGAVLGRIALEARQKMDAGEAPTSVDLRRVTIRVQDEIPGLVAAFRVNDTPWSWFHIPSWLAVDELVHGLDRAPGMGADAAARELLFQGLGDVLQALLVGVDVQVGVLGTRGDEGGACQRDFVCGARYGLAELLEDVFEGAHAS